MERIIALLCQLDSEPGVDDDGQEFQDVDVKGPWQVVLRVFGFSWTNDAKSCQVCSRQAPHEF